MSTLPPCADGDNCPGDENDDSPYHARPGGHPDGSIPLEDDADDQRALLAEQPHDVPIGNGDGAVNALAHAAEARLWTLFPTVDGVFVTREKERFSSLALGAYFEVRWKVGLSAMRFAEGPTLDAAIEALVAAEATPVLVVTAANVRRASAG